MTDFWLFSALLLVAGIVVVLWPLWQRGRQATVDRTALNVALFEERLAELEGQRGAGEISEEQYQQTRQEASRLLLEDTAEADQRQRPRVAGTPALLVVAAILMVPLVLVLYSSWGNPAGLALYRELQERPQVESLEALIDRMERITEVQPQNGEAWFMLGRAYMNAQQPEQAVRAFGLSVERLGERPEVLAQLAQARYFAAGNQLDAQSVAALDKALEMEPREPTALGLLGIAAFESADYSAAIEYWERLLAGMPPGSSGAEAIQGGIERARQRLGQPAPAVDEVAEQAVIRVRLEIDPQIAAGLDDGAVVFLFARDPNGPPMPLVAKRFALDELPAEVELSAADAMLPGVTLTPGQSLQLVARVSPDGDALSGSHQGRTDNVEVGAQQRVLVKVDQPL